MRKLTIPFFLILFSFSSEVFSSFFHISPYFQKATNRLSLRWEGELGRHPLVAFQNTRTDSVMRFSSNIVQEHESYFRSNHLYHAEIEGLTPGERYTYWVELENGRKSLPFVYEHPENLLSSYSFLVMSDAQHGEEVTAKAVRESVMKYAFYDNLNTDSPVLFSLFAGDLVQYGNLYSRWEKEFFTPLAPLLSRIPIYPALGNHEFNDDLYFSYFDLPRNGSPGFEEHWYFFDKGNVRYITLDTNKKYRIPRQIEWLESVLNEAQNNSNIDFVVSQFHHPHKSELWLAGEVDYSGVLEQKMIEFSKRSGKPSLYFCGHTHGYSRGHNLETNHTMLIVGSIGGAIDDWGDYRQRDYDDYVKTLDQFGWLFVDVKGGDGPTLTFRRYGFGNDDYQEDLGVVDSFVLRRYNDAPRRPQLSQQTIYFEDESKLRIQASDFYDKNDDGHLSTLVQVKSNLNDSNIREFVKHKENWYMGRDQNAGINLSDFYLNISFYKNESAYVRVKYRDSSLAWSDFSDWKKITIK